MKQRILGFLLIVLMLILSNIAIASTVTFDYTADNKIQNWWLVDGSSTTLLATGTQTANWQVKDSITLDITSGATYDIIWQTYDTGGPAGFLGAINSSDIISGSILSSASWFVKRYDPNNPNWTIGDPWESATTFGNNGVSPWGVISGIDQNAEWIWTSDNQDHNNVFIKTTFTLRSEPIPEPATMLLFGLGLLGLTGVNRRKK